MSITSKMNEAFVKMILENMSKEDAIVKIAEAITNRDTIIRKLTQEKKWYVEPIAVCSERSAG